MNSAFRLVNSIRNSSGNFSSTVHHSHLPASLVKKGTLPHPSGLKFPVTGSPAFISAEGSSGSSGSFLALLHLVVQ